MKKLLEILLSEVRWCWNKSATWDAGVLEWEGIRHRYIHIGRLCLDLEYFL